MDFSNHFKLAPNVCNSFLVLLIDSGILKWKAIRRGKFAYFKTLLFQNVKPCVINIPLSE